MAETSVTLPLSEILDWWMQERGVTLDWSYEELIRHKDYMEIVLEFDYCDVYGTYPDVKRFLDTWGDDCDE